MCQTKHNLTSDIHKNVLLHRVHELRVAVPGVEVENCNSSSARPEQNFINITTCLCQMDHRPSIYVHKMFVFGPERTLRNTIRQSDTRIVQRPAPELKYVL